MQLITMGREMHYGSSVDLTPSELAGLLTFYASVAIWHGFCFYG